MAEKSPHSGPFAGLRVIDLTGMVFGPYATQIMADMGADVIKVEPPGGDDTRFISRGPVPGMSGVFVNINRGKRSVMLDIKSQAGMAALSKLIEGADKIQILGNRRNRGLCPKPDFSASLAIPARTNFFESLCDCPAFQGEGQVIRIFGSLL